jgi:putative transposase
VVLDEAHLLAAVRYVELNPVRAKLVTEAEEWPWSSASAHLLGRDDVLVKVGPMLERIGDWQGYLAGPGDEKVFEALRRHERTGRVLGSSHFNETLEATQARRLRRIKPGPRPKTSQSQACCPLCPLNGPHR